MASRDPYTEAFCPPASFRVLDSVKARLTDEELTNFKNRLATALEHFDALEGEVVTVACRWDPDGDHSRFNPYAQADPVNRLIRIPTHERCTNVTIFHELGHLAIEIEAENGADHPTSSEEFCSLYSIARQPSHLIDEARIPYFGHPSIPKDRWPEAAEQALEYRENHHAYIKQAKQWLGVNVDG